MRARYREVSLALEYNEAEDYSLSYQKLVQVHEQNEEYKTKMGKQDFVDMIALYPTMADPIHLDLLIVDEAQDLTPLQWTMVRHMAETAAEVVIAGDDDQAIHRWAGVDVRQFLRCSENIEGTITILPPTPLGVASGQKHHSKDQGPHSKGLPPQG